MLKGIKKGISIALCACMVLPALAGCGGNSTDGNGVKTVTIWSPDGHSKSAMEELVKEFNSTKGKEIGVEIKYEVKLNNIEQLLEVALQSDTAPDLFIAGDQKILAPNGNIVALDDLPGGDKVIEKFKDYIGENDNMYEGKTYSVPVSTQVRGLIYNKDMFKAAGLVDENGNPTPPETLSELREYAKKLTNPEKNEYGIIFPMKWGGFYSSDVGNLIDLNCATFNQETLTYDFTGALPVFETIMGIKEDGSYYPGAEGMDNDPARARFSEGGIGMKMAYSWDVGVHNTQFPAKCDWGVAPLPVEDPENAYMQTAWYKRSAHINAASVEKIGADKLMEVYNWLISDELLTILYEKGLDIPYSIDIIENAKLGDDALKGWKEFAELVDITFVAKKSPKTDMSGKKGLATIFQNEIWPGKVTPEEGIAEYNVLINEGFKKYCNDNPDYDKEALRTAEMKKKRNAQ